MIHEIDDRLIGSFQGSNGPMPVETKVALSPKRNLPTSEFDEPSVLNHPHNRKNTSQEQIVCSDMRLLGPFVEVRDSLGKLDTQTKLSFTFEDALSELSSNACLLFDKILVQNHPVSLQTREKRSFESIVWKSEFLRVCRRVVALLRTAN